MSCGRYFVHEHPATAGSWQEKCVIDIMAETDAWVVRSSMCRFGMTTGNKTTRGLVYTPTDFMTNSICIADQLDRKCLNGALGRKDHNHLLLESGRTREAQYYPPELCRAICRGLSDQLDLDRRGLQLIEHMDYEDLNENQKGVSQEMMSIEKNMLNPVVPPEERRRRRIYRTKFG